MMVRMRNWLLITGILCGAMPSAAQAIIADSTPYYLPYPIVFIHGMSSDSNSWNQTVGDYSGEPVPGSELVNFDSSYCRTLKLKQIGHWSDVGA